MGLFKYKEFFNKSKMIFDLAKFGIVNYTINKDGVIDVDGLVRLDFPSGTKAQGARQLTTFGKMVFKHPLERIPFKFGEVTGSFVCSNNNLTSLIGSPKIVGESFLCHHNKLTSLEGSPESVREFNCSHNKLTNLKGISKDIKRSISCENNMIINFDGFPEFFEGEFRAHNNPVYNILALFTRQDNYSYHPPQHNDHYAIKNAKVIHALNEYDVISGNKIILNRFLMLMEEFGVRKTSIDFLDKVITTDMYIGTSVLDTVGTGYCDYSQLVKDYEFV